MNRLTKLLAGVVGGYITVVMLSGCSEKPGIDEQGMAITLTHGDVEAEVSEIAFLIATATQDQRDSAVHLIAGSDLREHKYRLDSLLKQALNYNWNPAHEENRDLYIYFPVPEHLTKALAGQEFIVTWQPPVDDKTLDSIAAYTLQGDPIWIDAWNAPQTPVMVITYEQPVNYQVSYQQNTLEDDSNYVPFSRREEDDKMQIDNFNTAYNYQVYAKTVKIKCNPEPYILGDLEIYAHTHLSDGSHEQVCNMDSHFPDYSGCADVNRPYQLYVFSCEQCRLHLSPYYQWETELWEYDTWPDGNDYIEDFSYSVHSDDCALLTQMVDTYANLDIWAIRQ